MNATASYPFDYSRLYGNEKYSLQNMLLKEVNMPTEVEPGDVFYEVWSDRIYTESQNAWPLLKSNELGDAYLAGATDESFLAFASALFSAVEKKPIILTGACAVRYTDAGGFPCIRYSGAVIKDTPFRRYGVPLIEQSRRPREINIYG